MKPLTVILFFVVLVSCPVCLLLTVNADAATLDCQRVEEVCATRALEILISEKIETTQPTTLEERRLLREIDPAGMVIWK